MKKKHYKSAKPFFEKLLKNPEVRRLYEEEKAKSDRALVKLLKQKNKSLRG